MPLPPLPPRLVIPIVVLALVAAIATALESSHHPVQARSSSPLARTKAKVNPFSLIVCAQAGERTLRTRRPNFEVESTSTVYEKARARMARSHRRRHCSSESSSSSSSSDSEEGYGPRVSFKDNEDKKSHFELHERFRAVNVKYFKQIFNGTFPPKHLIKLAHNYTDGTLNKADEKTEDVQEVSGLIQLKRCFHVYGFAICYFAARPHVALQLHEALTDYRIRLSDLSVHCRFDSIRSYHYAFMSACILNGQDDPMAWSTDNQGYSTSW